MLEFRDNSSMSMELYVSAFYFPSFIFKYSLFSILAISNLVLVLLLLLVLSRCSLNCFSLSFCLDEISLTRIYKSCTCFTIFSSTFVSYFAIILLIDYISLCCL